VLPFSVDIRCLPAASDPYFSTWGSEKTKKNSNQFFQFFIFGKYHCASKKCFCRWINYFWKSKKK
jgi:hypothetical protein